MVHIYIFVKILILVQCVQFQKISIPTLQKVIGNSKPGRGISKAKIFKEKYEAQQEFTEGWGGSNQGGYGYIFLEPLDDIYSF